LTRTAIPYATITIDIHHFKEDDGIERINIDQTLTGGIQGTSEKRTMDWQYVFSNRCIVGVWWITDWVWLKGASAFGPYIRKRRWQVSTSASDGSRRRLFQEWMGGRVYQRRAD
jgi:hypothetical protein